MQWVHSNMQAGMIWLMLNKSRRRSPLPTFSKCGPLPESCCQLACFNNGLQVIRRTSHTLFTSGRTGRNAPSPLSQSTQSKLRVKTLRLNPDTSQQVKEQEKLFLHRRMPPAYLALAAGLSAPWTPTQRSEPDRRPGPEGSSDSGSGAPPAAGRALQRGWERTLKFS